MPTVRLHLLCLLVFIIPWSSALAQDVIKSKASLRSFQASHSSSSVSKMSKLNEKAWNTTDPCAVTQCHPSDSLSMDDLLTVLNITWDGRAKWDFIGLELGLKSGTLDAIKRSNKEEADDCFKETIKTWLSSPDLNPSRSRLAKALRSPIVGLGYLAEKLPKSQVTDDGESDRREQTQKCKGDTDYSKVNNTTQLADKDLKAVMDEVYPLTARYYELGRKLGVPAYELETLRTEYGANNLEQALNEVVLKWLRGRSPRSWRALVEAVASPAGGNDCPLAMEIARAHR